MHSPTLRRCIRSCKHNQTICRCSLLGLRDQSAKCIWRQVYLTAWDFKMRGEPARGCAGASVKGYENLHGYKLRFETTWLDK